MPLTDAVLGVIFGFLTELPSPVDAVDARVSGCMVSRLLVTHQLQRREYLQKVLTEWGFRYSRSMMKFWKRRALRAEQQLSAERANVEHYRLLHMRSFRDRMNAMHGVGGWRVEAVTDSEEEDEGGE
jgi:hypothetical protein